MPLFNMFVCLSFTSLSASEVITQRCPFVAGFSLMMAAFSQCCHMGIPRRGHKAWHVPITCHICRHGADHPRLAGPRNFRTHRSLGERRWGLTCCCALVHCCVPIWKPQLPVFMFEPIEDQSRADVLTTLLPRSSKAIVGQSNS